MTRFSLKNENEYARTASIAKRRKIQGNRSLTGTVDSTHSGGAQLQNHWECLNATSANSEWKEVADEFRDEPAKFEERHYKEFVTFLPFVRRFLYGEGGNGNGNGNLISPRIRVFPQGRRPGADYAPRRRSP